MVPNSEPLAERDLSRLEPAGVLRRARQQRAAPDAGAFLADYIAPIATITPFDQGLVELRIARAFVAGVTAAALVIAIATVLIGTLRGWS